MKNKQISHTISKAIANNELLWKLFRPLVKLGSGINYYRKEREQLPIINEIKSVLKGKAVLHGNFKGLTYPDYESFGSAIFPKLLGSYESELNVVWGEIISTQYEEIIDIGSAEGYYSVGLAMKTSNVVVAVDISQKALDMVRKIAQLNNVSDKVKLMKGIDSLQLIEKVSQKKCFILCDAEGFEAEIFNADTVKALSKSHILIEVHDAKVFGVSKYLKSIFEDSHVLVSIQSTDDIYKLNNYSYEELETLSPRAKLRMLSEYRSNIQEWYYLKPR